MQSATYSFSDYFVVGEFLVGNATSDEDDDRQRRMWSDVQVTAGECDVRPTTVTDHGTRTSHIATLPRNGVGTNSGVGEERRGPKGRDRGVGGGWPGWWV